MLEIWRLNAPQMGACVSYLKDMSLWQAQMTIEAVSECSFSVN